MELQLAAPRDEGADRGRARPERRGAKASWTGKSLRMNPSPARLQPLRAALPHRQSAEDRDRAHE